MSHDSSLSQWANAYAARVLADISRAFPAEPTTDPALTHWHFTRNGALARATLDAGVVCRVETGADLPDDAWSDVRAALVAAMSEPFAPESVVQRIGRLLS